MNKTTERTRVIFRDFDPSAADTWETPQTTWFSMAEWNRVMVVAFRLIGTGNIGELRLFAASDSSGTGSTEITSGTTTTKITGSLAAHCTGGISKPGVGMVVAECSYDDMAKALATASHVNVKALCATATDELGLVFIFSEPRYAVADSTKTVTQTGGYSR